MLAWLSVVFKTILFPWIYFRWLLFPLFSLPASLLVEQSFCLACPFTTYASNILCKVILSLQTSHHQTLSQFVQVEKHFIKKVLAPAAWLPFSQPFITCYVLTIVILVLLLTNTSCLEGIHFTTNSCCSLQNLLLIIRSKVGNYQLCCK